ncbi:hypothetical protein GCM10011514_50800 [Emticicia aquatilis]|uniref:DUF11 domain-containing protein n=1 Tax=Emticicia aquatilis TaxID=1537369 RepID=A0A916Z8Y7_9BACT|nr:DUF11 domain-containing protein [Emticicia aquatilis]GGD80542.1 hypothetical protein GCM10011514_50800 [Emticicia aquatilis]
MKRLLIALLLAPFFALGQELIITEMKTVSCSGSYFLIRYSSSVTEFNPNNKFFINFIDINNKKRSFELSNFDYQRLQFAVPSNQSLPIGKYKFSISSTNPVIEGSISQEEFEMIDVNSYIKNHKLTLESYTKTVDIGDSISLRFSTNNAKYPISVLINGFDRITIPATNGFYEHKFVINYANVYEIQVADLDANCRLENIDISGRVVIKTKTLENTMIWGNQLEDTDTLICVNKIINGFLNKTGSFDDSTKITIKLLDENLEKSYDVVENYYFSTPDQFSLEIKQQAEIKTGKYYFKAFSENPKSESNLLGPIEIHAKPKFTLSTIPYYGNVDTIKISRKDSLIFKIDITEQGPWNFVFQNMMFRTDKSPYIIYEKPFKLQNLNEVWDVGSVGGSTETGQCANIEGFSYPETFLIKLEEKDSISINPNKIDLSLTSSFTKRIVEKDSTSQWILKLKNSGENATNIKVAINIPYSPPFVMRESQKCTNGTFEQNIWNIRSLAKGDSCTLYVDYKPVNDGVWYVEAEVISADQEDVDSKTNNQNQMEDDFTRNCFSIPIKFASEPFGMQLIVEDPNIDINAWYKDNVKISNTGNSLQVTQFGSYSYSTQNFICPIQSCCPFIIEKGNDTNCCKPLEYILKN